MSSKMSSVLVLGRLQDLDERGVRAAGGKVTGDAPVGVPPCLETLAEDAGVGCVQAVDSGAEAAVLARQEDENKGVCVEAAVVHGLEAKGELWGGGEHVGTGSVAAD